MAISFGNGAQGACTIGGTSITTNAAFTPTAGATIVVIDATFSGTSDIATSATMGGVAMTKIGAFGVSDGPGVNGSGPQVTRVMFFLVNPPASGVIVVNTSSSPGGSAFITAASYLGTKTTGVPRAITSLSNVGTTLNVTLTTVDADSWIVASCGDNSGSANATGGSIKRTAGVSNAIFDKPFPTPGSNTLSANLTSNVLAAVGFILEPAPSSPIVPSLNILQAVNRSNTY